MAWVGRWCRVVVAGHGKVAANALADSWQSGVPGSSWPTLGSSIAGVMPCRSCLAIRVPGQPTRVRAAAAAYPGRRRFRNMVALPCGR